MGGGSWSTDTYKAAASLRKSTGASAFRYSDAGTWRTTARGVHADLDPLNANRESRDSAEHPLSLPIAVLFDVTGSMGSVPRALLEADRLPKLLGLILRKGYTEHPQVMFGAIGDATCDRVPLQVGQFESDNRMEDDLSKFVLEGGGGGQQTESYELALYFMARHVQTDSYAKRRHRGYLFIIGDEKAYNVVKAGEVRKVIGDELQENITLDTILREVQQQWDVYYILPAGASNTGDIGILGFWRSMLGQNVIELDDLNAVSETIALTVGLGEDAISLEEGLDDLKDVGSTAGTSVSRALATLGNTGSGRSPVVRTTPAGLVTPPYPGSGNVRL